MLGFQLWATTLRIFFPQKCSEVFFFFLKSELYTIESKLCTLWDKETRKNSHLTNNRRGSLLCFVLKFLLLVVTSLQVKHKCIQLRFLLCKVRQTIDTRGQGRVKVQKSTQKARCWQRPGAHRSLPGSLERSYCCLERETRVQRAAAGTGLTAGSTVRRGYRALLYNCSSQHLVRPNREEWSHTPNHTCWWL